MGYFFVLYPKAAIQQVPLCGFENHWNYDKATKFSVPLFAPSLFAAASP